MKIIKLIVGVLIILAIAACEKNSGLNFKLIGYWKLSDTNDTIFTFERTNRLIDNEYGLAFKPGRVFIERKNAGWCSTPPVTFADYKGTWIDNDSLINITVGYWGGLVDYQWKIVSIDNNELKIIKLNQTYQKSE